MDRVTRPRPGLLGFALLRVLLVLLAVDCAVAQGTSGNKTTEPPLLTAEMRGGRLSLPIEGVGLIYDGGEYPVYRLTHEVYDALPEADRQRLLIQPMAVPRPAPDLVPRPDGSGFVRLELVGRWSPQLQERLEQTGAHVGFGGRAYATPSQRRALEELVLSPLALSQPNASSPPKILHLVEPLAPELKFDGTTWPPNRHYELHRVGFYRTPYQDLTENLLRQLSPGPLFPGNTSLNYKLYRAWLDRDAVLQLANQSDVVSVGVSFERSSAENAIRDTTRYETTDYELDATQPGVQWLRTFTLGNTTRRIYRLSEDVMRALDPELSPQFRPHFDWIIAGDYSWDAWDEVLEVPTEWQLELGSGASLYLVQSTHTSGFGQAAYAALQEIGSEPFDPSLDPNRDHVNDALVWLNADQLVAAKKLLTPNSFEEPDEDRQGLLQLLMPFHPYFRLPAWAVHDRPPPYVLEDEVSLQIVVFVDEPGADEALSLFRAAARSVHSQRTTTAGRAYAGLVPLAEAAALARRLAHNPAVFWVGDHRYYQIPEGPSGGGGGAAPPAGPAGFDPNRGTAAEIPTLSSLGSFALFLALLILSFRAKPRGCPEGRDRKAAIKLRR